MRFRVFLRNFACFRAFSAYIFSSTFKRFRAFSRILEHGTYTTPPHTALRLPALHWSTLHYRGSGKSILTYVPLWRI